MSGEGFFSFIETGTRALLVTLAIVTGYIVLRRMARQMRKGVDIATRQTIDGVEMHWVEDGRLSIRLELTNGAQGGFSVHFEGGEDQTEVAAFATDDGSTMFSREFEVPAHAHTVVISTASERIYRRLPSGR